jgi:hypothetical protein
MHSCSSAHQPLLLLLLLLLFPRTCSSGPAFLLPAAGSILQSASVVCLMESINSAVRASST